MRLVVEDLACRRGERRLFEGVSFTLEPGNALLVTGPNGAGKSSLLRILAGLLPADGGRIGFEDLPREAYPSEATHYLGHRDAVKPALTVIESAVFWARVLGGRAQIEPVLGRVGLGHLADLPAGALSAGQRRRLALARLLASPRPLWLLDEPGAALDDEGLGLLEALLAEHRGQGGIVVAATHQAMRAPDAMQLRLGLRETVGA